MTTTQAKPRRRFFRYSLRTMMLVVTVFCILMATTAMRARDQKQAVDAILELGGVITYEHEDPNSPSEAPGPEWLRQLIGDEYFFRVNEVNLRQPAVNDATLAAIDRLTDMKRLILTGTQITDAGLMHLKALTNLRSLYLGRTNITDAGMVHFKEMASLRSLNIWDTQITDAGLEHLKGMTNLKGLSISGTKVTDAGLEHLKGLHNLRSLVLGGTQVTNESVDKLQELLPNCAMGYSGR